MKNLLFIVGSLIFMFLCQSCEQNKIRDDIDELNRRLDNLQPLVLQLNKDITVYQDLVNECLWIDSYTVEDNGDYVVKFTNGKAITVYSGEAAGELPVPFIRDGKWWYTVNGEELPMMSGDQQASATPVDGVTPQVRISQDGLWQYSFDNWATWFDAGKAFPRNSVSIFESVKPVMGEDGTTTVGLEFSWMEGSDKISKTVLLASAFDLTVANPDGSIVTAPLVIPCGTTQSYKVTQTNVSAIIIETNTWEVELDDEHITITAPAVPTPAGETDVIRIKIFSSLNECKLIEIAVVAREV